MDDTVFEYNMYDKTHADLMEIVYRTQLEGTDELNELFYAPVSSIHQWMTIWMPPKQTFFCADDEGIWILMWFSPWLHGAWVGMWIRDDKRRTKQAYKTVRMAFAKALELVPVVISVTKRQELIEMFKHIGYDISMVVPDLFGPDEHGYFMTLSKHNFKHLEAVNERR